MKKQLKEQLALAMKMQLLFAKRVAALDRIIRHSNQVRKQALIKDRPKMMRTWARSLGSKLREQVLL